MPDKPIFHRENGLLVNDSGYSIIHVSCHGGHAVVLGRIDPGLAWQDFVDARDAAAEINELLWTMTQKPQPAEAAQAEKCLKSPDGEHCQSHYWEDTGPCCFCGDDSGAGESDATAELIERLRAACLGGGSIPDAACSCATHEAARLIERLRAALTTARAEGAAEARRAAFAEAAKRIRADAARLDAWAVELRQSENTDSVSMTAEAERLFSLAAAIERMAAAGAATPEPDTLESVMEWWHKPGLNGCGYIGKHLLSECEMTVGDAVEFWFDHKFKQAQAARHAE